MVQKTTVYGNVRIGYKHVSAYSMYLPDKTYKTPFVVVMLSFFSFFYYYGMFGCQQPTVI